MATCFFASDLHGMGRRYRALFSAIEVEKPQGVFLGGDLLPSGFGLGMDGENLPKDFLGDYLIPECRRLKTSLGRNYPPLFLIPGNDDPKAEDPGFLEGDGQGLWHYIPSRSMAFGEYTVFGYPYVPPTPFLLKDWEKYDVSRYTPHGSVSPEEGVRTEAVEALDIRYGTIQEDLENLTRDEDVSRGIFLFHTPPHDTKLDRAALDGKMIDHVPLDVHVGSVAVRRFIEARQPRLCLHGHIHESPRMTGSWQDTIGRTLLFSGGHDGPELALIRFDPDAPEGATRSLLQA